MRFGTLGAFVAFGIGLLAPDAAGQSTSITYQGSLSDAGAPADGLYDMGFSLWDAAQGGGQIGPGVMLAEVPVAEGLFTVELDFGAAAFDNAERWLEITVEGTPLSPRQPVTRTPYAIQTRGITVSENEHVGMGVTPGGQRLRVWNLEGRAIEAISVGGRAVEAISTDADITVLGSNQTSDGIGVFGQNQPTGNRGYLGSEFYGVLGRATDRNTSWAGYFQGRGYFSDYTLIGRDERVTGAEFFGVRSPTGNDAYGGMYLDTLGSEGWPFYGYATGGTQRMWHYYDGSTDKWHINNGGNRVTVTGSGDVGIGITDPGARMDAWIDGASNAIAVRGIALGSQIGQDGVWGQSNAEQGSGVFGFATRGSGLNYGVQGASVSTSGYDFYASGNGINYGSASSARWKREIEPIGDALDLIDRLRGVRFRWDTDHGGHRDIGFVAEEVGEVLPEIVAYEANGEDASGMDYTKIGPVLVEAVKELRRDQRARIGALESENAELRERVRRLEAALEVLAAGGR